MKSTPKGTQRASRLEFFPGLILLSLAIALVIAAGYRKTLPPYQAKLCLELAAPILLAAGAFLSAFLAAKAMERGPRQTFRFVRRGARPLPKAAELLRDRYDRSLTWAANRDWLGDWLPIVSMISASAGALYLGYRAWSLSAAAPTALADQWLFGILISLCFPLLVLERRFAAPPARRVSEAAALSVLLRVMLLSLLLLAMAALLRWLALPYALVLERAPLLLTGLVAAEILLRNATYVFLPLPPLETRPGRAESLMAGLLRFQKPSVSAFNASISRQFGIDLGRSWALGFVRRAALPSLIGMLVMGWLLTGVTALDLSERAVYEAFGQPQAVFHSGLHVHLPWPLGRLRPVEFGAVREIPIVFPAEAGAATTAGTEGAVSGERPTIEGTPPESADRLWDASHPSEASYLVASNRNGQETFEVVNIDLQILYRIGLSDQAALNAVYGVDNAESLIRASAGRMLARYFARYTIADVLGQNRDRFVRGFQQELQSRLDALNSGVDVLGVVIEAIHPPADAATSYQDVQAAGIRSETQVATARGDATAAVIRSHAQATSMRNDAQASGTEMVDQAKVDTALFAGDVAAYHKDGAAFLFERRLTDIGKAIRPETPVTILDSHIPSTQMPTLDLRPAGAAQTPPPYAGEEDR